MDKHEKRALDLETAQKSRCTKYPPVDTYELVMEYDISREIERHRRLSKTYNNSLVDA